MKKKTDRSDNDRGGFNIGIRSRGDFGSFLFRQ